ncbi:helix-turn-helix transcriptional regulator [Phyllobacterium lublinensis]|uniref:helix-turn-helix transcriptional regulator n=1 Tax=Phyllobacterium lublinensis TaxID=2875708 RepID=UPI001CCBCEFD|nr:response regulator transcription factor [Phyllobacterium sp. 2063]MBZ9654894.1 response regulator transcription factor [Phyllobacterium sp. 2063]
MSVSFAAEVHGFNEMHSIASEHISIVVIDCQTLSRSCLIRILRGELPDVAVHDIATSDELVGIIEKHINLAVINIENCCMTDAWVAVNLAYIHQLRPETALMLLTQLDEASITDAIVSEISRLGVKGYTTNTAPVEVVLAAIRLILAGGAYYPRSVNIDDSESSSMSAETPGPLSLPASNRGDEAMDAPETAMIGFTERERQVLATLRRGLPNKIIASELDLSENTIKVHISHIMRKLNATNRTEAVVFSQKYGSGTNGSNGSNGHGAVLRPPPRVGRNEAILTSLGLLCVTFMNELSTLIAMGI